MIEELKIAALSLGSVMQGLKSDSVETVLSDTLSLSMETLSERGLIPEDV